MKRIIFLISLLLLIISCSNKNILKEGEKIENFEFLLINNYEDKQFSIEDVNQNFLILTFFEANEENKKMIKAVEELSKKLINEDVSVFALEEGSLKEDLFLYFSDNEINNIQLGQIKEIKNKIKNLPTTVFINWENKIVKIIDKNEKLYNSSTEEEYIEYFKNEVYEEVINLLNRGEEEKESSIREE